MKKWEYKLIEDVSEASLNQLGDQGWELVAYVCNDYAGEQAILKREVQAKCEAERR